MGLGGLCDLSGDRGVLILSAAQRRRNVGLHVPMMTSVILPLGGSAIFGAIVVAILNSFQGIPFITLLFVALLTIGGYVLKETAFGLSLYAIGNNDEAARRAGINVAGVKMAAFAIAGGIAAIAGVVAASRSLGVGVFSGGGVGGGTLLLETIAAAVIGGVSLFGGRGAIYSALLGALVIGTVSNGLNLMGVEKRNSVDRDRLSARLGRLDRQDHREGDRATDFLRRLWRKLWAVYTSRSIERVHPT